MPTIPRSNSRRLIAAASAAGVALAVAIGVPLLDSSGSKPRAAATPSSSIAPDPLAVTPIAVTTAVDTGPTTFPVRVASGQSSMGTFSLVLNSRFGPAIKVVHPGGSWSGHYVSVMWMSHVALKLELHPGVRTNYSSLWDPGYSSFWTQPAVLYPVRPYQIGLAATFNGGFKLRTADSRGGYWDYGGTRLPHGMGQYTSGRVVYDPTGTRSLTAGAASLVINKNGTWNIGTWRHEIGMTSNVAYVRQELLPMIDNGVINPLTRSSYCQHYWGVLLGTSGCYQWRSAVGITAAGDLVYASAANVNPYGMALIMLQAGATRAMQLDVNPEWMAAEYYTTSSSGAAVPHVVRTRYFSPYHYIVGSVAAGTAVNRDFFAAYRR